VAKRLFYLALPAAMLGLQVAIDLSACAGYPGQHASSGALAELDLFLAVIVARAIGVWFGLIYCRWSLVGALVFGAAQIATAAIAVVAVADAGAWSAIDRFCTDLGAAGLTSLLVALVGMLLVGCYATRRAAPSDQQCVVPRPTRGRR
jgi:hypothetical protein